MIESAVWVTCGELGRQDFIERRRRETRDLPDHRNLGRRDCFHDGTQVLSSVNLDVPQLIKSSGRACDPITPSIVALALEHLLVPKDDRDRAAHFRTMMKRILHQAIEPDTRLIPSGVGRPEFNSGLGLLPGTPLSPVEVTLASAASNWALSASRPAEDSQSEDSTPIGHSRCTEPVPAPPFIVPPEKLPPRTDMTAHFPRVTIEELFKAYRRAEGKRPWQHGI